MKGADGEIGNNRNKILGTMHRKFRKISAGGGK